MKTKFGEVDGKEWEQHCQKLLKLKYGDSEGYQPIPARFGGDLGIEGFTHTGRVFQCYCPDGDPTTKELYEKQRDKITSDIGKFLKNESELRKILGGIVVSEWHFLTPSFDHKDLLSHCTKKSEEVKGFNKSHIASDFKILIKTEDYFIKELGLLVGSGNATISPPIPTIEKEEIIDWSAKNNSLIETASKKLEKIQKNNAELKLLIAVIIKNFMIGQNILTRVSKDFPTHYEQILRTKNAFENRVETMSNIPQKNPGDFLERMLGNYEKILDAQFGTIIDPSTIQTLVNEAISDWIIRCPLDF